jgi:hypothetical protein
MDNQLCTLGTIPLDSPKLNKLKELNELNKPFPNPVTRNPAAVVSQG